MKRALVWLLIAAGAGISGCTASEDGKWYRQPPEAWPPITMINEITYTDMHHPIAGCAFLLDLGSDTLAVTAKHILTFFKSESMNSVSFRNRLESWKMYPKDHPDDGVLVDRLLNEDEGESIERVPSPGDWLLFTIKEKSPHIQVLQPRETPLQEGEPVFIVGWRYSDKDCPQVIYKGAFVRSEGETHIISTERLSDNTMPGLSGSPVVDARGRVIGLMSQKAGKLERVSSLAYPMRVWRAQTAG